MIFFPDSNNYVISVNLFVLYLFRLQKEKQCCQSEVIQTQQIADKLLLEKESAEKERKQAVTSLNDLKLQLDEALRNLVDANTSRQKLSEDRNNLIRHSDEKEVLVSQLQQQQSNLKKKLSNALKRIEEETKVKKCYKYKLCTNTSITFG